MAGPQVFKQVHAVVDDRTTVVCLDAAGQIRPVDEPFDTLAGPFDAPPFHIHCRTGVVPWLPGFVSDQRSLAAEELAGRPEKERRRVPPPTPTPAPEALIPQFTQAQVDVMAVGDLDTVEEGKYDLGQQYRQAVTLSEPLTPEEEAAVLVYGTHGHTFINGALRNPGMDFLLDGTQKQSNRLGLTYREAKAALLSALGKSRLTRATPVTRGMGDLLADVEIGDIIHNDAFSSTSMDPTVPRGTFSGGTRRIALVEVPAGFPALQVQYDELELLLPPGLALRVVEFDDEVVRMVIVDVGEEVGGE